MSFHQGAVPQLLTSPDGVVIEVNAAATALLRRTRADVLGSNLDRHIDFGDSASRPSPLAGLAAAESQAVQFEVRLGGEGGPGIDALVSLTPVRTDTGSLAAVSVSLQDVTCVRQAHLAAQQEHALWLSLTEYARDVAVITDVSLVIQATSPSVTALMGQPEHALVGTSLLELVHPADRDSVEAAAGRAARDGSCQAPLGFRVRDAAGQWRDVVQRSVNRLGDPFLDVLLLTLRDETERHLLENDLRSPMLQDRLTGLGNRPWLIERLEQAAARHARSGQCFTVLLVAVDDLHLVNARHGEGVGDQVLQRIAARLSTLVRSVDSVARYGGDEFAVLLADVADPGEAEALARQIATNLDGELEVDPVRIPVSVCVGVTHSAGRTAEEVLSAVTSAGARARAHGRAQVHVLTPDADTPRGAEYLLAVELREAVADQAFSVHYQPIVELATGAIVSVEALVRWTHPRLGLLVPDRFLPTAVALDLLGAIDDWVLEQACCDAQLWRASEGHDISVAVNVTPDRLTAPGFSDRIKDVLRSTGLAPSALTLEVTETGVIEDLAAAALALEELAQLGVGISIDDFGTGYSSMLQLRRLPCDRLKIDREFTRYLPHSPDDIAICSSVIELAKRLGVRTTAEGVENAAQAAALMKLGCQYGQGFLWSAAVEKSEVPSLLKAPPWQPDPTAATMRTQRRGIEPLTDDPVVLALVRMLEEDGASVNSIAAHLNMRGLRTAVGRRWQAATVARLLVL